MRSDVSRTIVLWQPTVSPSSLFELRRGSLRYDRARLAVAGAASEGWWSQTGSNRRPHACKARALPAELWPRTRRRMLLPARTRFDARCIEQALSPWRVFVREERET